MSPANPLKNTSTVHPDGSVIEGGAKSLLIKTAINTAIRQAKLIGRGMVVKHAFSRVQYVLLLDVQTSQILKHVLEVTR